LSITPETAVPSVHALPGVEWKVNPFLHVDETAIYNPLTHQTLTPADAGYAALRGIVDGGPDGIDGSALAALAKSGWMVRESADLSRDFHLRIVSLETATACNQKCYFCPVSIAPRADVTMPTELFESLVEQLDDYRGTLEAVFLQSYNEPTLDRRFVDQCRTLFAADLPVAVLSNGSGLTPAKVDALVEAGPLRLLSINLSTLDRERYKQDRGEDHLQAVLRNLEYAKSQPVADEMKIVVLGTGNTTHQEDFEAIRAHFAGSRFLVEHHVVMDRAGWLEVGLSPAPTDRRLAGCDNVGSRPLQHLHITPAGKCVLCCEDYDENYIVGDLTANSIGEVLAGPELALMRRWVYGLEEAPADFMCRKCIFARTRPA
jgi:MoaA/NifB/PqqE/SkfB family radical SAM enzyme